MQLRILDIDAMGHVNNAIYFQLMDLAKMHYFTALGGVFDGKEESLVIVNVNCNFYSPAYFTENIEVLTGVEYQRVVNADTGDVKCVCHTVMAAFDPVAVRAIPVSGMWRSRIGEFEGRDM